MGIMQLRYTYTLLSYLRATVEVDQKSSHPSRSEQIVFSDMTFHAEGARALITDKKDGQKYELLLRPIELAEGNATIPRSFGEANEY